jgi:tol-pal system protein YbgF
MVLTARFFFVRFLASTWRRRSRPAYAVMAGLILASLLASRPVSPSFAQEAAPPAAKAQGGDSVGARLGRLEEKIKDLQVTVGTLESFIRAKPGAMLPQETPAAVGQGQSAQGDLGPRLDALETQITALTRHIEQIGQQMSALEAKLAAAPAPTPTPPPPPARQGQAPSPPSATASISTSAGSSDGNDIGDTSKPRWYGPKPGSDEAAALEGQAAPDPVTPGPQSLTAALPGGDAQTLYQQGYGALLQKDYAGAEGAFRQLVDAYPHDPLAANAQYWIGESYYVRGQYKDAADAFLKGYKNYKSGEKAPDTLLKLGMALAELGQKDAACSTLNELKAKYPGAPEHIGEEAKAWRKKTGC